MAWPNRTSLWREHREGARDDYARVAQAIARFEPITLIANGAVIAPAYGIGEDTGVFETLRRAHPGREVVPVALKDLFRGGGGIHCATQQEPLGKL